MSHSLLSQSECRHYCISTVHDDIIVAMTMMSSCTLAVYVLGECVVSSEYYIIGDGVYAFPVAYGSVITASRDMASHCLCLQTVKSKYSVGLFTVRGYDMYLACVASSVSQWLPMAFCL